MHMSYALNRRNVNRSPQTITQLVPEHVMWETRNGHKPNWYERIRQHATLYSTKRTEHEF